jgi:hypothetical protein
MRGIAGIAVAVGIASVTASGQTNSRDKRDDTQKSMTLVGCVMGEPEYRSAHGLGKGALAGAGLGNEFVLVDASEAATSAATPAASGRCSETGNGKEYRLTGSREKDMKAFVGKRVEITGTFDHERDARTAAGETNATLPPEIKIASFREPTALVASGPASSTATTAASSPTPAPASVEARNEPPSRALPKTATNLPLVGLIGVMSLFAALGLRLARPGAL